MNLRTHITLLIGLLILSAAPAFGQFSIPWSTIDGGGAKTTGGTYALNGTIGQPDANAPLTGGTFTLTGGFWPAIHGCIADFNNSGTVTPQDIFDYLAAYFGNCQGSLASPCFGRSADVNGSGTITPQDIFDFLAAYFAGCS